MREEVSKYHRRVFSPPTPPSALEHWIVCLVALSWVSGCICTTRLWLFKLSGGHSYLPFAGEKCLEPGTILVHTTVF